MFSMASSLSGFSIGAIFGGIEQILGNLSPAVSGDASNVGDNNLRIYSRSFVSDIFLTTQLCFVKKFVCIFVSHPLFRLECYMSHNYNLPSFL